MTLKELRELWENFKDLGADESTIADQVRCIYGLIEAEREACVALLIERSEAAAIAGQMDVSVTLATAASDIITRARKGETT